MSTARRIVKSLIALALAGGLFAPCSPAAAQQVALPGQWYDQDKVEDPVLDRDWYFEYFEVDGDGNGVWRPGNGLSKTIADTTGWVDWSRGHDATCWAAAAANMVQYMSGVSRYMAWVYESDWPDGSTWTWQDGGGTVKALDAECYATDVTSASAGVWSANPAPWIRDMLTDSRAVSLGVVWDDTGGISHLVTCYAIDTTARTVTIACSDTEHGGGDYDTYDYTYIGGVFKIIDYYGDARMNNARTFSANDWQGSGTGGKTSTGGDDCYWDRAANWSAGHAPEAHVVDAGSASEKASRVPRAVFENSGLVVVRTADARAIKLILRGSQTHLMVDPGAALDLGSLFMEGCSSWGLTVAGTLTARRADSAGGRISVEGGELNVLGVPDECDADFTFTGVTTVNVNAGGSIDVGRNLHVYEDNAGWGRLHVSDGGFGGGGGLHVGGDATVDANCWLTVAGPATTMTVGRDLELRGSAMTITRAAVRVAGHLKAGHDRDTEITVAGGTLEVGYMFLGFGTGTCTALTLEEHDAVAPQLLTKGSPMNLYMGWYGSAEVTQNAGSLMRADAGDPHPNVHLGYYSTASGTYEMNGGTVVVNDLSVGHGGDGEFTQNGGLVTVHGQLTLAHSTGSDGTYTLAGGTLNAQEITSGTGSSTFHLGGGSLILSGPTHSFGELNLGTTLGVETTLDVTARTLTADRVRLGYGDRGTLNLSASTLTVSGELTVGYGEYGKVEQTGGSVSADEVLIGSSPAADASSYVLNSGDLRADLVRVGRLGYGKVRQYGGTVDANEIQVGVMNDSILNIYYHYGGTVDVDGPLALGYEADSRGRYLLDESDPGTDSLLQTHGTTLGRWGDGGFDHLAGEHLVFGELLIGDGAGSEGSYWLAGGDLTTDTTTVGNYGTGRFDHLGGRHEAGTLRVGVHAPAEYALSGAGWVTSVNLYVGDGADANFVQPGGRNDVIEDVHLGCAESVTGTVEQSGGTAGIDRDLYVGYAGSAIGVYRQTGGTCTVGGDVYVGYGADSSGTVELGGASTTGTAHTVGGSLYIGCGAGANGTYRLSGGGIYTPVLTVTGDIVVGDDDANGALVMNGGRILGSGTLRVAESTGRLEGSGEIHVPAAFEGSFAVGPFQDVRFYAPLSVAGTTTVDGFLQLNDGGTFDGPVVNNYFFHALSGTLHLNAALSGSGSVMLGAETLAAASIEAGHLEIHGALTTTSPVTAFQTAVYSTLTHTAGDRDLGDMVLIGFMGMGGSYTMEGPGNLETTRLMNYGLFTQNGGTHVSPTVEIGGYNMTFPGMYPGPGTHVLAGGQLLVGRLLVGHADDEWFFPQPGLLSVTDASAEITISQELVLGSAASVSFVPGTVLHMTGSAFTVEGTDPLALADLANLTLLFEGPAAVIDPFEVAGADLGPNEAGWVENFALGRLELGVGAHVRLVDVFDNCLDGNDNEALYVDELDLASGAWLDRNGLGLYFRNGGAPKELVPGDFDLSGDVGREDFLILEAAFGTTEGAGWLDGDTNGDGAVDCLDYLTWKAGAASSSGGAIPEPGTLGLLALGGCLPALGRWRSRRGKRK